jgi:signal transduction histidine kinase
MSCQLYLLTGSYEAMIGQPIWKFNAEEEPARKRILGKLAGGISPSKGYELTYRRKDGATIWLLAEDRLILDSEGRITGMRGIFQDITERKRTEEALQQRTLELQHLTETLEDRVKERTAELANLSSELLVAQEKERKRIAYNLHDNVWQTLEIIRSQLDHLFSREDEADWTAVGDNREGAKSNKDGSLQIGMRM